MATIEERTAGGVSFGLTDEQRALRDLAHDFAEREIRPKEREYDEHSTHPADVIAKAHELGLMNVHIPEAYGGLELGAFEGMLIGEELCLGLLRYRERHRRQRPGPRPGHHRGHGGAEARMAAARRRGRAPHVLCADRAERRLRRLRHPDDGRTRRRRLRPQRLEDVHHERRLRVVVHRLCINGQVEGPPRVECVHRPGDADGLVVDKHLDKMGQRSTDTSSLSFSDVRVPAANRLGEEGEGFKIAS